MFAVMGVTGQVGGAVARALLAANHPVRAIVRTDEKGASWKHLGCDVAVATNTDVDAMTRAFSGVDGVFVLMPPNYDPEPGYPQTVAANAAVKAALLAARPPKAVVLSTVGAQVERANLLNNLKMTEAALGDLPLPILFLRAGWFYENTAWDLAAARTGVVKTFLQPLDHVIPMIAVEDIGTTAASLLQETWTSRRVVELEAARRYSANDIGASLSRALGHPVRMEAVAPGDWVATLQAQGVRNPTPRLQMVQGFNEGWIDFEGAPCEQRRGETDLDTVFARLVAAK
jgi:NAD(P)H dehydrogenase (quinone)